VLVLLKGKGQPASSAKVQQVAKGNKPAATTTLPAKGAQPTTKGNTPATQKATTPAPTQKAAAPAATKAAPTKAAPAKPAAGGKTTKK